MIKKYATLVLILMNFVFVVGQNQKSIDSCKVILNTTKNDTIKMRMLSKLSTLTNEMQTELSEYDKNLVNLCNKILSSNPTTSIKKATQYYLGIGFERYTMYYYNLGDFEKGLLYAEKRLTIFNSIGNIQKIGDSYNDIAVAHLYSGRTKQATDYFFKALKIDEKLGNKENIANSYTNIASIYYSSQNYKKSLELSLKGLEIGKELGDDSVLHSVYNNIGMAYAGLNKYKEAIPYLEKTAEICKKIKDLKRLCVAYNNLSLCNLQLLNFKSAEEFSLKSIEICRKNNFYPELISALNQFGKVNISLKKYAFAKKQLEEAHLILKEKYKEGFNTNYGAEIFLHLSEANKFLGNYEQALEYSDKYHVLIDTLTKKEKQNLILEKEIQYTYDKKTIKDSIANANQKIIASAKLSKEKNQKLAFGSFALLALVGVGFTYFLYRQKRKTNYQLTEINDKINRQNNTLKTLNTELIVSEENLQKSNSSKEQLISMMSHDLLNPITAITNYNQQIISRKNNSDELLQAFKTVDAAIQPMHGLLDNMLHWTAIQKDGISSKLKNQDINDIIKEIIGIYRPQAQLKFIKLLDNLDKDFIHETDKSILSLILRNLINNAIKYSGNETEIEISSNSKTKTITIKDQGFGMTDEMIGYLNTKQLDKIEAKGTGLGLKLCYEFAEAIGAEIVFEKNENGTTVFVNL